MQESCRDARQRLSRLQGSVSQLVAELESSEGTAGVEYKLLSEANELSFALVSDLDKASRDARKFKWHAFYRRGVLRFSPETGRYRIEWLQTDKLENIIAVKNRSMELSELVRFDGKLFAMCDSTGLVFEIDPLQNLAFQRQALPDGNGKVMKPFKAEWATVKDGKLLIGSMGREWVGDDGQVEHFDPQWIKSMDRSGRVTSINWRSAFQALRVVTNTTLPGYLWHEAIIWDALLGRWLVLPRKASEHEPYTPESDETRGCNILLLASEDFSDIELLRIGPLEPEWGFTALRKVPGTNDTYAALKVLEVGKRTETKITVFDLKGNMLLDSPFEHVDERIKYEGLEFTD
eukprot:TRINITY_DN27497_c0_g1_i1.p1 TRINITY_DN27497_c0_g1~~TRINITY_DN27497_c0_g1_i1.p1  ORF type:complete len:398 (-),score=87.48 TRINITY_DN27497_c0_g1_i1:96-1139(-)